MCPLVKSSDLVRHFRAWVIEEARSRYLDPLSVVPSREHFTSLHLIQTFPVLSPGSWVSSWLSASVIVISPDTYPHTRNNRAHSSIFLFRKSSFVKSERGDDLCIRLPRSLTQIIRLPVNTIWFTRNLALRTNRHNNEEATRQTLRIDQQLTPITTRRKG